MPRKRTRDEMEASVVEEKKQEPSLLQRIRNMWEFASVMQFIFTFGKAIKIDEDFDIEDFENECLKPGYSEKLEEIGLTLLKWISSHRGLNYDIWDEYTRRQYLAKAPHLNPYGDDEEPKRFRDFDIFTKIRILHQLTVWTFWNPDRLREKMTEHPREADQTEWRIEEFGWDRDERQYYLLDDNRFYRRTEPSLPAAPKAKPKSNSKKAIAARRRESKRRKLEEESAEPEEDTELNGDDTTLDLEAKKLDTSEADTFGGFKWECLCINLPDYQGFCNSLKKSKDPDEKALRDRLMAEVIPIIEAAEERRRRKIERRERDLMLMERMVGAKRSSRLADKQDRERRDAEQAEADRKRQADLNAARQEQEKQERMEQDRQYRMMTREQRIKDREYKRILKEEELARDELEQKRIEEGESRGSDRALKQRMERNKKELEELEAEEDWTFDCSGCGVYGKNLDDGTHIISCERCNVWQHSKCLGISKSAAEKDDFHFICRDCRQKEEDAKKPRISLKFRVGASSSPAPPSPHASRTTFAVEVPQSGVPQPSSGSQVNGGHQPSHQQSHQQSSINGTHPPQLTPKRPPPPPLSNAGRMPSPVFNRPIISPTQGNMDVGPLAGVPYDKSQSPQPISNGVHASVNGMQSHLQSTPTPQNQPAHMQQTPISRVPNYPLSGLSPKKQQTPIRLPPPSAVPQKSTSMSPPRPMSSTGQQQAVNLTKTPVHATVHARTISGTPILPPVENLRPSPQQLRNSSSNGPVPTPSKQHQPHTIAFDHHANDQAFASNAAQEIASAENGVSAEQGMKDTKTLEQMNLSHAREQGNMGQQAETTAHPLAVMQDVQ